MIHRSTLRYRLRRIRELTGHELGAVDTRLNLHIATRAWQLLGGSDSGPKHRHRTARPGRNTPSLPAPTRRGTFLPPGRDQGRARRRLWSASATRHGG